MSVNNEDQSVVVALNCENTSSELLEGHDFKQTSCSYLDQLVSCSLDMTKDQHKINGTSVDVFCGVCDGATNVLSSLKCCVCFTCYHASCIGVSEHLVIFLPMIVEIGGWTCSNCRNEMMKIKSGICLNHITTDVKHCKPTHSKSIVSDKTAVKGTKRLPSDKTGQLLPEFDVVVKLEKYDTDDTVVIETNRNRVESPVKKKKTKPSAKNCKQLRKPAAKCRKKRTRVIASDRSDTTMDSNTDAGSFYSDRSDAVGLVPRKGLPGVSPIKEEDGLDVVGKDVENWIKTCQDNNIETELSEVQNGDRKCKKKKSANVPASRLRQKKTAKPSLPPDDEKKRPNICSICGAAFTRKSHLYRHERLHSGLTPYECTVCGKKFRRDTHLTRHQRIHTKEQPYQCKVCEKKFNQSSALVQHKRIHTGEKPYECVVCNMKFNQSSALITHKRIHTGEKPYLCPVCGESFKLMSNLNIHKRIHTGEKPYECTVCNKKFNQSSALVIHNRIHTGEKPYLCTVCGKSFKMAANLNIHRRHHTGEKPYECVVCNKKFSQSSALMTHKKIHAR